MAVPTIEARGVGKHYRLGENAAMYGTLREALGTALRRGGGRSGPTRDIWALRDVDLSVHEGEAMGLIGSNGAGKTTLLRILARITEPTVGVTRTRGRVGALLEVGTGFHPELSGRDNVFLSGAVMGMTRATSAGGSARSSSSPASRHSRTPHSSGTPAVCAYGSRSRSPPTWSLSSCWWTRSSRSGTTTSSAAA